MKQSTPIPLVLHFPTSEEGMQLLYRQIADVQASFVLSALQQADYSQAQTLELLTAIMDSERETPLLQKTH